MDNFEIKPYLQTPEVRFNATSGKMLISGKSYPADAIEFYQPVIAWTKKYVSEAKQATEVVCDIEYLNSASQKQLVELFMAFKPLHDEGKGLQVKWKYEEGDDDIFSVGELIENELGIPFLYEEMKL